MEVDGFKLKYKNSILVTILMDKKEVSLIEEIKEINEVINNKIRGKKIIFTEWYKLGLLKRGISEDKFNEVFPQFEKIYKVEKETLKSGDIGYEFFYKFSNNTDFSIGTIPKDNKVLIIHLIEYKRSLESRFKKFKQ